MKQLFIKETLNNVRLGLQSYGFPSQKYVNMLV